MKRLFFIGLLVSGPAMAAGVMPNCEVIHYRPNKVYVVTGRLFHWTHITLPGPLAMRPIVGNPDLWDVSGQVGLNHVYVKPNSELAPGNSTTLNIIVKGDKTYDFLLKRVRGPADYCVNVSDGDMLFGGGKAAVAPPVASGLFDNEDATEKATRAVKRYQNNLFTAYRWSSYGSSSLTRHLVSSVYDDGRFTYIRLNRDAFGVPVVYGYVDGEKTLVEADYDSSLRMYKVAGLFQRMDVGFRKGGIHITRGGAERSVSNDYE